MRVLECKRTISAMLVATVVVGIAGCNRTTAGTAGEGGNPSASAAPTNRVTGSSGAGAAAQPSDSAGRVDSAAGNIMLNPNGVAATTPAQGTTSMFLPTLGTTVQVPTQFSTSPNGASGSGPLGSGSASPSSGSSMMAPISPFIPMPPTMNPNFVDSNAVNRPHASALTNPLNTTRPNSTMVRPMTPGSTATVPRRPE
jgi:hypothetical protein